MTKKKKMIEELNNDDKSIIDLLVTGKFDDQSKDPVEAAQQAIDLVKDFAKKKPNVLLEIIFQISKSDLTIDMLPLALAALMCASADGYLDSKAVKDYLIKILKTFGPGKMLELVEMIKSKVFGRGLGSTVQKIFRTTIENWDESTVTWYSSYYANSMKHLVKLIHPRINGRKGNVLKRIF